MKERAYTLAEIDAMRNSVKTIMGYAGRGTGVDLDDVEDRLRTYMYGGVSPDDLSDEAKRIIEERREQYNRFKAKREAMEAKFAANDPKPGRTDLPEARKSWQKRFEAFVSRHRGS